MSPRARRLRVCVPLAAGLLLALAFARAQSAATAKPGMASVKVPAYDVVSIKPNKTGSGHVDIWIDDGNFTAQNVSLRTLIESAYGLKKEQVEDLPKWANSMRFDVRAKTIEPDKKLLAALTPEQFRSMQLPILTDRFQLKFHRATKVLTVYDLVVVKSGPKFQKTTAAEMTSSTGVNGVRAGGTSIHNRNLIATGVTLSSLADSLSGQVSRIVVDKAGLTGNYNFELSWSADDAGPPAANLATWPDIFTAVEEQLGLKLQPAKAEIQTFVVDRAMPPAED